MNEIVSTIVANGLWAMLFCGLLVYQLRDGRRREQRYTETISSLADRLKLVEDIKEDTAFIRSATTARAESSRVRQKKPKQSEADACVTSAVKGGVPCKSAI